MKIKLFFLFLMFSSITFAGDPYAVLGLKPGAPLHEVMYATAKKLCDKKVSSIKDIKFQIPDDMNKIGENVLKNVLVKSNLPSIISSNNNTFDDLMAEPSQMMKKQASKMDKSSSTTFEIMEAYTKIKYNFPAEINWNLLDKAFDSIEMDMSMMKDPNRKIPWAAFETMDSSLRQKLLSQFDFKRLSSSEYDEIMDMYKNGAFKTENEKKILITFLEHKIVEGDGGQKLVIEIFKDTPLFSDLCAGIEKLFKKGGRLSPSEIKQAAPLLDNMLYRPVIAGKIAESATLNPESFQEVKSLFFYILKKAKESHRTWGEYNETIKDLKKGLKLAEKSFFQRCKLEFFFRKIYPIGH